MDQPGGYQLVYVNVFSKKHLPVYPRWGFADMPMPPSTAVNRIDGLVPILPDSGEDAQHRQGQSLLPIHRVVSVTAAAEAVTASIDTVILSLGGGRGFAVDEFVISRRKSLEQELPQSWA